MTSINIHVGRNGSGYKVAFFTGNPKPSDRVVTSVLTMEALYNMGEFLQGKGVSEINLTPAIPNPNETLEDVANELVNAEGFQADIYTGTFKIVSEQMELFGKNHKLEGLPSGDLEKIYRELMKALAS